MNLTPDSNSRRHWFRTGNCVQVAGVASVFRKLREVGIASFLLLVAACATNPYEPRPGQTEELRKRAEVQTMGSVRVSAAVPSPEETKAIFGLSLYDQGLQPVWLEVENRGDTTLRYAPVGTDADYVPPFEVAYTNRAGFSRTAFAEMETYLLGNTMPRQIEAGQIRSGYVITRARPGTKGVNVDLYGPAAEDEYNFIFFVPVPGFVADHAQVNFESIYAANEVTSYGLAGLRKALDDLPCCPSDASGKGEGYPINFVFVGDGDDVLQALLRAGWYERLATERSSDRPTDQAFMFGRTADAVFRSERPEVGARNELRIWMAPVLLGKKPVWVGDVVHLIPGAGGPIGLDPDVDDARDFLLQDLWYAQSVTKIAWLQSSNIVPIDEPKRDATGLAYFTDGARIVIWPSGRPVSLLETEFVDWDSPPQK